MLFFFGLSLCGILIESESFLRNNVMALVGLPIFSRVYVDLSTPCNIPELAVYCDGDCSLPANGRIGNGAKLKTRKKDSTEDHLTLVDLLKVPEAYTGYRNGASEVWSALKNITWNSFYRDAIDGIQYSISVHMAAFYKKINAHYIPNPFLFKKICGPEKREKFLQLLKFAKNSFKKLILNDVKAVLTRDELRRIHDIQSIIFDYDGYHIDIKLMDVIDEALRILDCTACERCKLWGKIQFVGLRTFIKAQKNIKLENIDELIFATNFLARLLESEYKSKELSTLLNTYSSYIYLVFIYYQEILGFCLALTFYYFIFKKRFF